MPDGILEQRFYGLGVGGWHRLGHVQDAADPLGAVDAYSRHCEFQIDVEDVQSEMFPGQFVPLRLIWRGTSPTLKTPEFLGAVGPDYTLIPPREAVQMWDKAMGNRPGMRPLVPVETMGVLDNGRILFVTAELPAFAVAGDAVRSFMLAKIAFGGNEANGVYNVQIRTVCKNTLNAGIRSASEAYRIIHGPNALEDYQDWLNHVYQGAVMRAEALAEAYNLFAARQMNSAAVGHVLEVAYPEPRMPSADAPRRIYETRRVKYMADLARVGAKRTAAEKLFDGRMLGHVEAVPGSGWALFNAVTELEGSRSSKTDEQRAYDMLFGPRAATMGRAFEAISEVVSGGFSAN